MYLTAQDQFIYRHFLRLEELNVINVLSLDASIVEKSSMVNSRLSVPQLDASGMLVKWKVQRLNLIGIFGETG
jgi:hypothetical protein